MPLQDRRKPGLFQAPAAAVLNKTSKPAGRLALPPVYRPQAAAPRAMPPPALQAKLRPAVPALPKPPLPPRPPVAAIAAPQSPLRPARTIQRASQSSTSPGFGMPFGFASMPSTFITPPSVFAANMGTPGGSTPGTMMQPVFSLSPQPLFSSSPTPSGTMMSLFGGPPPSVSGSGHVGAVGSHNYDLNDANNLYRELEQPEIDKLGHLLKHLNRIIKVDQRTALDIEIEYVIRRIFRDMGPLNYGLNPELRKLWEAANKGIDTSKTYKAMRTGMTPQLKSELPDTYDDDFYRRPEIHHATYQSIVKQWENKPYNLYLTSRGGKGIVGQHDTLHYISSAAHGSPWQNLVPAIRSVIEDETGMTPWQHNSRPSYLFAPRQVGLTDDRQQRPTDLTKLIAEAIATTDARQLPQPDWPFRILP